MKKEMITILGGTFMMEAADDYGFNFEFEVTVSDFELGVTPITQAQWRAVMGSNPSCFSGCDQCPVENVSWDDVQLFLQKINAQTDGGYRLPTEAEWEYAARGGRQSQGYEYAGSDNLDDVAWYGYNSGSKTHPVGLLKPNELGIYDMSGNVWEWCQDWYGNYPSTPQNNPKGPDSGSYRIARGGSWNEYPQLCRVALRYGRDPGVRNKFIGFRLARTI